MTRSIARDHEIRFKKFGRKENFHGKRNVHGGMLEDREVMETLCSVKTLQVWGMRVEGSPDCVKQGNSSHKAIGG